MEFDTSVILEESKKFDAIILNTDKRTAFEPQLKNLKISIVNLKWLETCILEEKFVDPKKFEVIKTTKAKSASKSNSKLLNLPFWLLKF